MLMTAAIFLLMQKVKLITSPLICRALANLTKLGFGVYCVHYFFVEPSYLLTLWLGIPIPAIVPVSAVFTLAATWLFVYLLSKLPYSKYIIG